MIYNLNGMYETPEYREKTHLCLYHNNLCEDYPPHWHSPIEVLMPIENSYTIIINDVSYVVNPYELLFIGPGVIHSTLAPSTGHRYFFQIDVSRLKSITGVNPILSFMGPVRHFTPENAPDIHRKLVKLFEEICDEYYNSEEFENPDVVASKLTESAIAYTAPVPLGLSKFYGDIHDMNLYPESPATKPQPKKGAILSKNNTRDSSDSSDNNNSNDSTDDEISKSTLCEPIIYAKFLTMLTLIGRKHLELVETDTITETKKKEYTGKFMTVCRYIDDHFAEEITLEEVASIAGFSKFHFSRLFKQFTNISFYKYVNQQRIAHAEELLANPDLSVTQIAIQCGFSSTSSFIRMFKQIKNCTPTDFRKMREKYSFRANNRIPITVAEEQYDSGKN